MSRIIALANQKGGTGKTTTTINLVAGLARYGQKRVLLIDIDPQANATAVFLGAAFVAGPEPGLTVYDMLKDQTSVDQIVRPIELAGQERYNLSSATIDLVPAHINLALAEQELVSVFQRESRLSQTLQPIRDQYDFIIIDCPPSLGLLTINALMAANEILIPIEPGIFPLIGLGLLQKTIETVKAANPNLKLLGLLPVRLNRTNLAAGTVEELQKSFGDLVLTPIPERVIIGEAHAHNQDIFLYGANSDGAEAYRILTEEVLHRA